MWKTEQIIALAPDASSEKNGRALADSSKWLTLGRNEISVWGECRGSGKNPYRTALDLREPAFKCSCPSRKFPCKHALGLFLLFAAREDLFTTENPPEYCAEWLEKRDTQKSKKEAKAETELTVEEKIKRDKSKAKRAADRENKVAEGFIELETWLRDLIRQGLAAAKNQPASFWEKMAMRMIDAQAAGAARMIRELSGVISLSENWTEDFLEKAGKIFLLIEAYKNLGNLPESVRADVKTAIGWTVKEDELEKLEAVKDKWFVVGHRVFEEEKLRVQRTWLIGENSRRDALLLDFAFQNQPLISSFAVGTKIEAELIFYPGNFPLRAVVKNRGEKLDHFSNFHGMKDFHDLLEKFSDAVSRNLWLEIFPAALEKTVPVIIGEKCFLRDNQAKLLPLAKGLDEVWNLIAFSGGEEISVFGEWNGKNLFPLRAFGKGRMIVL